MSIEDLTPKYTGLRHALPQEVEPEGNVIFVAGSDVPYISNGTAWIEFPLPLSERLRRLLSESFMTHVSGGGAKSFVKIEMETLEASQRLHEMLLRFIRGEQ